MATDLPKWVWDLVIALNRHEDEHSSDRPCFNDVLKAVPLDVREQAEAIRAYAAQADADSVMNRAQSLWQSMFSTEPPANVDTLP